MSTVRAVRQLRMSEDIAECLLSERWLGDAHTGAAAAAPARADATAAHSRAGRPRATAAAVAFVACKALVFLEIRDAVAAVCVSWAWRRALLGKRAVWLTSTSLPTTVTCAADPPRCPARCACVCAECGELWRMLYFRVDARAAAAVCASPAEHQGLHGGCLQCLHVAALTAAAATSGRGAAVNTHSMSLPTHLSPAQRACCERDCVRAFRS
jgi:hypothetical protein